MELFNVCRLNLQDIKEGRFEWEADGKTVTIDGAAAAAGEEGGAGGAGGAGGGDGVCGSFMLLLGDGWPRCGISIGVS